MQMDSCGESLRVLKAGLKRYRKVTVVAACCSAVVFLCHLTTKTGTSQSIAQFISQKTSLPSVYRDTGIESTSKRNDVGQAAATSRKRDHKIIICTLDSYSGGPEALFQLAFALFDRGFNVYRTSELASVLRPLYPEWEKVPSLPRYGIRKLLAPGDIVLVPEYYGAHGLPKVKGVRVVRWILAGVHSPIPGLSYLHHSFYLAHANKSPASAVVMPYIHTNRTGFREGMYQLGAKRTTICVDNDAKAVADLITNSGLRSKLKDDSLEVKVVEDMHFAEIEELYRRCKVVIDKALPGMERVPLEAASFGAIVLLDDDPSNSIGAEWLDFPIPTDYVGSWDVNRLESTLYKALTSYEQEMMKFEPLRHRIAAMESQFVDAVDRVFGETATFLIPCNKPEDGANCLRAAISVLLVSPLSMVRLITRDDEAAFMATNTDLYQVLGEAHMDGLVTAGAMNLTSHFDEVVSGAPNHRVILMAPDMVLIDGDELRSWSKHNSSSHHDCMVWVPTGLDVKFMDEAGVAGKICPTLKHSFEDFSVIESGNFVGDPSYLYRFAHLCSSPIWKLVMASSQSWRLFCASIERSSRS